MAMNDTEDFLSPQRTGALASATQTGASTIQNASGTMREAESYTPAASAFTSNRLNELLSSDSPYIKLARDRASTGAFARGLGNSSIAVGAAEGAAIDRALPIAQDDARTTNEAGRYNVEARNLFSRDSNQFQRDSALTGYRGALDMRGQDMTSASNAAERAQRAEQFTAGQVLDRERLATDADLRRGALALDNRRTDVDAELRRAGLTNDQARTAMERERTTSQVNAETARTAQAETQQRERAAAEVARLNENKAKVIADLTQSQNLSSEVDSPDGTSPKDRAILNAATQYDTTIRNYAVANGINLPGAWPAAPERVSTPRAPDRAQTAVAPAAPAAYVPPESF